MSYQQFSEVCKTWTDLELFQLLQNRDDYQDAVKAAKAEMNSRKLAETELAALLRAYGEKQFKKQHSRREISTDTGNEKGEINRRLNPL